MCRDGTCAEINKSAVENTVVKKVNNIMQRDVCIVNLGYREVKK